MKLSIETTFTVEIIESSAREEFNNMVSYSCKGGGMVLTRDRKLLAFTLENGNTCVVFQSIEAFHGLILGHYRNDHVCLFFDKETLQVITWTYENGHTFVACTHVRNHNENIISISDHMNRRRFFDKKTYREVME